MKKIIKPAEQEEAVYYSDFTGKCFGHFYPEVTMSFQFDYGSKYDGQSVTFHLSDEEAESVMEFIKSKISADCKKTFKQKLDNQHKNLNEAIDARDYTQSDYYNNSCTLIRFLLNQNVDAS